LATMMGVNRSLTRVATAAESGGGVSEAAETGFAASASMSPSASGVRGNRRILVLLLVAGCRDRQSRRERAEWLLSGSIDSRRFAKVEWIAEVLQFPIIIEGSRPLSLEPQLLQELDLVRSSIATEGAVPKEFFEPSFLERLVGLSFNKLELERRPWGQPPAEHDFHGEAGEIDIPRFNQGI